MSRLAVTIGGVRLKNPVIAASGEHLIDDAGILSAIRAGAGAVVMKSANESAPAQRQLLQAEYAALDHRWNRLDWSGDTAADATLLTRSGLSPLGFDDWLAQAVRMDLEARKHDCLLVGSVVMAGIEGAVERARALEAAGIRVFEFNIGTPMRARPPRARFRPSSRPSASRIWSAASPPRSISPSGSSCRARANA
ncbi:hypothetical protein QWZ10_04085 [Paracoccus cavernae]|uniref:Dihydroorotate dehydrogenase domain-containing protein n=1 Tax=Paracoccus cavernae TaxID=1571207 RepID=A0ABT8D3W8_9RHOB|nr:hypothetical protein [Paracoccus cavernae]